jgi:hypothetical protein
LNNLKLSNLEIGCRTFEAKEPRDSMYRVSTFLIGEWWGDPARLVDALSVLLLVWNSSFYRTELGVLLQHQGENYAHNFQYSILEIADLQDSGDQICVRECHWKNVLMSREFGYNAN